ncbi:monoacylglycerol lipase abhd6-B-like [Thalassophryne amazonica]|uniref:monoacylglycerol lipase abhd6-B-like n=1 Tax=Thalassophryne amazonica TaxID=390379 RepID=UPI001471BEDB|nr:monoacylglycerol lipase abhd6-B-like [Thalassophryne amazonica]XP_034020960.1 monoacylglycerol lipase abhd6-B-like [Thalassophryne amazonica]
MDPGWTKTVMLTGSLLVLPVVAFIAAFLFRPGILIKIYNWYMQCRLGLQVRYAHSGNYRFCYSCRGTPGGATPSLLLLHGFSANKDLWLGVVKYLPSSQHVVCVDMPGHEGTSRPGTEDYSIQGQVSRIHQFVQSTGLNHRPFHLVGSSMGGNVAGVYAACYPAHLSALTLISPAGLMCPSDSEFICRLRELEGSQQEEVIPLIPSTVEEMEDMLRLCNFNSFSLPRQVLRGLLENRIPHNSFYKKVFTDIVGEKSRYSLQEHMHLITVPLQVIWGKEDQVLDVSGATVLQKAVPGCQVVLLDHCGHSVALERPRKTAKLITDFLSAQTGEGEVMKKHS